jgi:hypothetical protein
MGFWFRHWFLGNLVLMMYKSFTDSCSDVVDSSKFYAIKWCRFFNVSVSHVVLLEGGSLGFLFPLLVVACGSGDHG